MRAKVCVWKRERERVRERERRQERVRHLKEGRKGRVHVCLCDSEKERKSERV